MALGEYESLVNCMLAMKIPREKAEEAARKQLGMQPPSAELIDDDSLEDEIVDAGDDLVRALGFDVVRLSQKRKPKITPGVPDRYYVHRRRKLAVWWEAKASWGKQRPEQHAFQRMCDEAGQHYVLGGLDQLRAWLTTQRVAEFDARGLPQPLPLEN